MQFDKFLHAFLCLIIAFMAGVMQLGLGSTLAGCLVGGAVPAMAVGLTKEWTDKSYGGKFDFADLLADIIGTIVGIAVVAVLFIFGD